MDRWVEEAVTRLSFFSCFFFLPGSVAVYIGWAAHLARVWYSPPFGEDHLLFRRCEEVHGSFAGDLRCSNVAG